jgi:hypothetical protein
VATERTLYVPAIVDDNRSEMVNIGVETKPGTGEVFVSVTPAVGLYTQQSEKIASDIAFAIWGEKECDVFLRIFAKNEINQVDGPSAGAAISLLLISALSGEPLRDDFSVTGTIEDDGTVGLVGGIPLKAEAVAKLGKKLFIVPVLPKSDKIGIILIKKFYNLTVFEASDISAAYDLAASNRSADDRLVLEPETKTPFVEATIDHPQLEYFKETAKSLIDKAENGAKDAELHYLANFESRLQNAKAAFDKKQYYTAANIAYTLAIDEDYANYSPDNLRKEIGNVNACISSFTRKNITVQNFELTGPAELRYVWSKKRLPQPRAANGFVAAEFSDYDNALFAKYWCDTALRLNNYSASENETSFDGKVVSPYAKDLLNSAVLGMENVDDEDLQWHLDAAKAAYEEGLYVASIIDSNFVLSSVQAASAEPNASAEFINEYINRTYKYLWPQLYQNHAKSFGDDRATAARMLLFASKLNESFDAIERIAITSKGQSPENQNKTAQAAQADMAIQQGINEGNTVKLLLILVVIVFVYAARKHGSD